MYPYTVKGNELSPECQQYAKTAFVNRFTGDNKPQWAYEEWKDGQPHPLQFANDEEWLANTSFEVRKDGKINRRCYTCISTPTWPNNPELRK